MPMVNTDSQMKQNLIVTGLTGLSLLLLAAIFVSPIWWVSLTAPNYPPEAFPDGVRIQFHMTGVFNGCRKVEKEEIQEVEALDCVHEMDTINHYVGMYPIAAGGPIERAFSQFLMPFLGVMLLGFVFTSPGLRTLVMGVGFAAILVMMYLTIYADDGFRLESEAYVTALVTSLDQDTSAEAETPSESGVVAALRRSLEASGVKVDGPPAADSAALSYKARLIKQLSVTFERDQQRTGKDEAWNGSTFQVMSWHYGKSLGRYFNNPAEIEPMVKTVKMATHVVFGGLIAAMLLLLVASRKTGSLFYWLLVLVPIALPVFFIIDYTAWLWFFGHNLNAMGAFTVKPFMPTVFGQGKVAQFATHSYPSSGFGLMLLMSLLLGIAALTRRKQLRDAGT
jgi:ABC-type sugar transport system permease subunit